MFITNGWLRRFCDMLVANRDWLRPTTFAEALDATLPMGKVYIPDSSYREMTEWVLPARPGWWNTRPRADIQARRPAPAFRPRRGLLAELQGEVRRDRRDVRPDARDLESVGGLDPGRLGRSGLSGDRPPGACIGPSAIAPYWHGAFGGLYLPHLRNAIYRHLISAQNRPR